MSLTNKQRVFIEEYLRCWNATEAARLAGYAGNDNTLASIGSENLIKPKIKEAIEARLAEKQMTADEVLTRLTAQARGDIGTFLKFYDGIKDPFFDIKAAKENGLTPLIKKLKYNSDGKLEVELYDAQSALVQIGRVLGMFTDKVEHSGNIQIEYVNDWREN